MSRAEFMLNGSFRFVAKAAPWNFSALELKRVFIGGCLVCRKIRIHGLFLIEKLLESNPSERITETRRDAPLLSRQWWTLLISGIQDFRMGSNTHLTFLLAVEPRVQQCAHQVYQRTACLANESINALLIRQQEGNFKGWLVESRK